MNFFLQFQKFIFLFSEDLLGLGKLFRKEIPLLGTDIAIFHEFLPHLIFLSKDHYLICPVVQKKLMLFGAQSIYLRHFFELFYDSSFDN